LIESCRLVDVLEWLVVARIRIRRPLLALIVLVLLLAVGYAVRAAQSQHSSHRVAPVIGVVHTLVTGAPARIAGLMTHT
jgi:hypothetical protein